MKTLLRINMKTQTAVKEAVNSELTLTGGRSFIANILTQEMDATAEPLSAENKLIFCPGMFSDTAAPGSGRISVGGKSPLTGTIKESNSGGTMAKRMAALKLHGLVVDDKPQDNEWFIIVVDSTSVEFISAEPYLGMNTYQLSEELRTKLGDSVSIAAIGLAGERQYLNSSVQFTDPDGNPSRSAARGGLGAVMGSKGIKAIVFKDVKNPAWKYADKEKFLSANKSFVKAIMAHPFSGQGLPAVGTSLIVNGTNEMGILPTNNFSKGRMEGAEQISGEKIAEIQPGRGGKMTHACHAGCVVKCSQVYNDKKENYLTSGLEYESIGLLGSNCGITDIDVIATLDNICDDLGVDTMDTGCAIGVCMDVGMIEFGDTKGALDLAQQMVDGTEFGRILGGGTAVTGKYLGAKRIPTVKGQALAAYDPRGLKGTGVTYATSPMGADHTAGNSIGEQNLPGTSKDGQVELSRNLQVFMALVDTLGLCLFSCLCCDDPKNAQLLVDMAEAKYGGTWDIDKLLNLGVQTLTKEKKFNKDAGFTDKDDRLPDFMYTEVLESVDSTFDIPDSELAKTLVFEGQ